MQAIKPLEGDLHRVDLERLDQALDACDFLLAHLTPGGEYEIEERWGAEGALYRVQSAWTLLEAYRITRERKYLDGALRILDHQREMQLPAGGWPLALGPDGMEFKTSPEERQGSWQRENLPMIGTMLYAVAKYRRLTGGDARYDAMMEPALQHLLTFWDPKTGGFLEKGDEHFTALRSLPVGYQSFYLLGLAAWQTYEPSLAGVVSRLAEYMRRNFEGLDDSIMPFMRCYHIILLMRYSAPDYVATRIKAAIDQLVASPTFRCDWMAGAYGHRDSQRGIVTSEANCRGSGAVAISMRYYDLATGTMTYRQTAAYHEVAAWFDAMKAEHGFYEYLTRHDGQRKGQGSSAQYIPCWWILGDL
jgi:hypothetical protein